MEVQQWLIEEKIKIIYIEPLSSWQNEFAGSFRGRSRDECLNREQLWTLIDARVVLEDYRIEHKRRRPHSRLSYRSSVTYAATLLPPPGSGVPQVLA